MDKLLHCRGVVKTFKEAGQSTTVLQGVDLSLASGQQMGIIGRSGSGKTTLLNCLAGLDKPTAGEIFFETAALHRLSGTQCAKLRNQSMGFIFQFHFLMPDFTALENVAMPLRIRGLEVASALGKAEKALASVGLSARLAHKPGQLSGGERQRAAIARALVTTPKIIFADEPTGNLDEKTAQEVIEVMLDLTKAHQTSFVVVTHDQKLAKRLDVVKELAHGKIIE